MRLLLLIAGLWFASNAAAAGLAGTCVLQGQQGLIVAKIEVSGTALAGSIDPAGQGTMKLTGAVTGNRARGPIMPPDLGACLVRATDRIPAPERPARC